MRNSELFDEVGNIRVVPGIDPEAKKRQLEADKLNGVVRTVDSFSYVAILWCIGAFYGFLIEENKIVGSIFLALALMTFIYFIYLIWKKRI